VAGIWKSSGRLADGREIIYFDESPGLGRADAPDTRELPPAAGTPAPGLRRDPLTGEWVVIAADRQDRTFLPPPGECPLDPSAPGRPTEIPAGGYDVVVFENRFPSLRGAGRAAAAGPAGRGLAYGRCEVVCFTADHDSSFARLPPRRVRTVLEAWADRSTVLGALPGIRQVYCFENRGEEIGVTLHHPHGQIYAFGFVTPRMRRMLDAAAAHTAGTGGNLFDDLVAAELAGGSRIVTRNADWVAFVPPAARWPFEVLIFPVRRVPRLPALDQSARNAFGEIYLDVLRRLDALFGAPLPYIAAWHQAPVAAGPGHQEFGLHLQVLSVRRAPGKLKYLAGTESGAGVWINDVVPETAARRLREAAG
jgi:UDPglucose--hexose-1-phosphate uridylyltransferase